MLSNFARHPLATSPRRGRDVRSLLPGAVYAQRGGTPAEGEPVASRPRQVAVDPFTNVSGAPSDDWSGAGITATVVADIGLQAFSLARGYVP